MKPFFPQALIRNIFVVDDLYIDVFSLFLRWIIFKFAKLLSRRTIGQDIINSILGTTLSTCLFSSKSSSYILSDVLFLFAASLVVI